LINGLFIKNIKSKTFIGLKEDDLADVDCKKLENTNYQGKDANINIQSRMKDLLEVKKITRQATQNIESLKKYTLKEICNEKVLINKL